MITVSHVKKTFPNGHEALRDVTLSVDCGEFVCIIGRSGAGKSTLLRCLNGLIPTTAGSIQVDGVVLESLSGGGRRRLRQRIGFIFQEFNLVERLSVMNNVLAGRLGHRSALASSLFLFSRADREVALRSLERVNLAHKARQRADSLSGGEKQRVAIARALAQEPVVVLADEPVASLDPELAWSVMSDLHRTAREEGIATLVNIHEVRLARAFADRVIGIAEGVVTFDGAPSALDEEAMTRVYKGHAAEFGAGEVRAVEPSARPALPDSLDTVEAAVNAL